MLEFIRKLKSPLFHATIKKYYENQQNATRLRLQAQAVIQALIYDVYSPEKYKRTQRLLNSFKVGVGESKEGSVFLYSDPDVATPKQEDLSEFSYAAFFQRPVQFHSFLKPRKVQQFPENYRPFFSSLERLMEQFVDTYSVEAMLLAIYELMPNGLK